MQLFALAALIIAASFAWGAGVAAVWRAFERRPRPEGARLPASTARPRA